MIGGGHGPGAATAEDGSARDCVVQVQHAVALDDLVGIVEDDRAGLLPKKRTPLPRTTGPTSIAISSTSPAKNALKYPVLQLRVAVTSCDVAASVPTGTTRPNRQLGIPIHGWEFASRGVQNTQLWEPSRRHCEPVMILGAVEPGGSPGSRTL
jgi:hypothetical protein